MSALDDKIWTNNPPKESGIYWIRSTDDGPGDEYVGIVDPEPFMPTYQRSLFPIPSAAELARLLKRTDTSFPIDRALLRVGETDMALANTARTELAQLRAKAAMAEKLAEALRNTCNASLDATNYLPDGRHPTTLRFNAALADASAVLTEMEKQ